MQTKEYKRQWRIANSERIKKYQKAYRKRNKYKAIEAQRRYRAKPETKEKIRITSRRTRLKHLNKDKARSKLRNAVRDGTVKRETCEVCGDAKTHGHHTDYTKPLEVKWLCQKHHAEEHARLRLLK